MVRLPIAKSSAADDRDARSDPELISHLRRAKRLFFERRVSEVLVPDVPIGHEQRAAQLGKKRSGRLQDEQIS